MVKENSFLYDIENLLELKINQKYLSSFSNETVLQIIDVIKNCKNENDQDTINKIFENQINLNEKKRLGQFYTSNYITRFIVEKMNLTKNDSILDLSCGTGAFLLSSYDYLSRHRKENEEKILSKIYGIEIKKNSLEIAKLSLWEKTNFNPHSFAKIDKNLIQKDSLSSDPKVIFDEFPKIIEEGGFSCIVGNPPYVTVSLDKKIRKDPVFSKIIFGQVNAATLMIGRAFTLLKEGGRLGLLLPKTLFRVKSYQKLRKFLLQNFQFEYLIDVGIEFKNVRGEQVILIATKTKPKKSYNVIVGRINKKENYELESYKINIKSLSRNGAFLLMNERRLYDLIPKIFDRHNDLDYYCDGKIFRGIPIGANSKFISTEKKNDSEKCLRGDSIKKFGFNYFIYLKKGKYPKIDEIRKKKIVLQNIFSSESGIIADYDDEGVATLDTVTNVFSKSDPFYILGILNSKLARFFMVFVMYNQSRLTMHSDRSYIGQIPIPKASKSLKKQIEKEVKSLIKNNSTENLLNSLVFSSL